MHQSLLDLLHPVRFLPDMDQVVENNGTPLEQASRAPSAWHVIWPHALGLRMGPVPGEDIQWSDTVPPFMTD